MTYGGIDRKRFTYLLSLGADEFELKKFFTECRAPLIQHGGKVQNLPQGKNARIRTLAVELPPATDDVVQTWFAKHVTMVDPEEVEAVVGVFKRYEEVDEVLPEDSARRYSRSCLVHLFGKDPAHSLLDFLKSPIGGTSEKHRNAIDIADTARQGQQLDVYPDNLPQVLVDLVEGKDADEHLEGLPPALATFISGLQAGAQGQVENAREAVETLLAAPVLRIRLEEFLKQSEAKAASKEYSPRGLRIAALKEYEGLFDFERDEILGYCTKADSPNAVFVQPLAVVRSNEIQLLTSEKRQSLFPQRGDVMAFAGAGHPRQPRRGEIGVWRIAEHETEKATHFHLAIEKRPVYEVRTIPFPSTDYDSVREFLKEQAAHTGANSLQPLIFQLDDGLIVGSKAERQDFSKDEVFESGILAWTSLSAVRLEGRLFILGPLPKEQALYECASLASTVRKLFRTHISIGKTAGGLTRAQLRDLAKSLDLGQTSLDALRIQRIKEELERLGEQQDALDALVIELQETPCVKKRIEKIVEQEVAKLLLQKNSVQEDISRLRRERGEWEQRINKQQAEHRKQRDDISKVVKAAFEKACADGVSTLADVAVFQALSAPATIPAGTALPPAKEWGSLAQPIVRELNPADRDFISTLRSLGVPVKRAAALEALGEVALKAGLIVCVKGIAARLAVEGWAKAIGRTAVLFDSTIGLVDTGALGDIIAAVPRHDVLALLDANLSALDIYARPISDVVFSRLTRLDSEPAPAILLALTDGVGSLPLPKTFEGVSVSIDLDTRYVFRSASDLDEMMSVLTDTEEGTAFARLWKPAADRLRVEIEKLDPVAQVLVLSILTTQ